MLREITLKLIAGQEDYIALKGNYIRIKSAPYDLMLRDTTKNEGNSFVLSEGDNANFDEDFERIGFKNIGQGDSFFTIIIGKDASVNSSKVGGSVQVVNGEIIRVKSGTCFMGCASAPSLSNQFAGLQLWNPPNSGKNLILSKLIFQAINVSTGFSLIKSSAPLTQNSSSTIVQNKDFNSSAINVGLIKVDAINSAPNANIFGNYQYLNGSSEFPFLEPILISQSTGLLIHVNAQNVYCAASMQWYEEKI